MNIMAWVIRLFFYLWAIYEIGSLLITYYNIKTKNGDKIFLGLLFLCASMLGLLVFMMTVNITSHYFPEIDQLIRNSLIIPVFFISASARFLRILYQDYFGVK